MNDWRRAIRTPLSYSVPGASSNLVRQQTNFVTFVIISGATALLVLYTVLPAQPRSSFSVLDDEHGHNHEKTTPFLCPGSPQTIPYNSTYPLTPPERLADGRLKYHIATVADLDKKSRTADSKSFVSYLLKGTLILDPATLSVDLKWNEVEEELSSQYSLGGRGMELSDLVVFNGRLYTCDDRTGIIYELHDKLILPWVVLRDGDGKTSQKGFKCEWMLVKDKHLYVGGLGKEWTSPSGDLVLNHDPQWVKRVSPDGQIEHLDWRSRYVELRHSAGIEAPGYLIHEAAVWSDLAHHWYFLPRRASKDKYDEVLDEKRGTNILLTADNNFTAVTNAGVVGPLVETHGFSSVKLLPLPADVSIEPKGSEIAIAIKSEEENDSISTFVIIFRLPDRQILLPETRISSKRKFEGIEFI